MPASFGILCALGAEGRDAAGMATPAVCPGSPGWAVKWWGRQQLRVGGSLGSQCGRPVTPVTPLIPIYPWGN